MRRRRILAYASAVTAPVAVLAVLVIPVGSAGETGPPKPPIHKNYDNYPNCHTWTCVKHTRELRKQRWKRCNRNATPLGTSIYSDGGRDGAYGSLRDGNGPYFARLQSGGEWFGRFKPGSRWTMILGHEFVRAKVRDWGSGGGPLLGHIRAVDAHTSLQDELGFHDNVVLRVTRHRCE